MHREHQEKRWDALLAVQEQNTKAMQDLTNSTQDIVAAWSAALGAVKVGKVVGGFAKWLGGFAVLGVVFSWISQNVQAISTMVGG